MATFRKKVAYIVTHSGTKTRLYSKSALSKFKAEHIDCTVKEETIGWEAIVRRKGVKPTSKMFAQKGKAQAWASQQEASISKGDYVNTREAERVTLSELFERYKLQFTPRKRAARTELGAFKIMSNHLGHVTMGSLSTEILISYIDMRLQTVKSDTIRREIGVLNQVVKTAMAVWGIRLQFNPVDEAKKVLSVTKTLSEGDRRDRRVSHAEMEMILQNCSDSIAPIVEFAVETGMRRGELAKAKHSHIVNDGAMLHIPETKTDKPRTIPLSSRARTILASLPACSEHLFNAKPDSITRGFNRACKRCGINDVRFHDLRHEAASRFFEKGLEIQEVALITGHADWRSLKRYTHIKPEDVAKKLK